MSAANAGIRCFGWAATLLLSSACTLQQSPPRTSELAAERARAARAEHQVSALEGRLARLESQLAAQAEKRPAAEKQTSDKLDRLIAAQERLVQNLERLQTPAPTTVPAARPQASSVPAARSSNPALADFIQDLVERAQSDAPPWRGGLSREKREALRILLKPERTLDVGNPMEL